MDTPAAPALGPGTALELEEAFGAPNYHPLPVVLVAGEGAWVTDDRGRRLLDCLAAYSSLNFGHRHPRLVDAAERQLGRITLTSRAFHNELLGPFCRDLAGLCRLEMVLPMNTGTEAVETAIKAARRWGYEVKGVPDGEARIIVFDGNFHGRSTTIVGFSSDPAASAHFGPFAPGFDRVPYGDLGAVERAIGGSTVAVLVEPVQGEAGVIVPPDGYLAGLRRLCDDHRVLLVADEIQSGLGRTGTTFACDHESVRPDLYVLGKALGGGIVPLSAVVGTAEVLERLSPGSHGSTFGGNPLACAVGIEVVALLGTGEFQRRSAVLGERLLAGLRALPDRRVAEVRGRGLWAGLELHPGPLDGRELCERLLRRGVLAKEAHGTTVRLAPPLVIDEAELDWAVEQVDAAMAEG